MNPAEPDEPTGPLPLAIAHLVEMQVVVYAPVPHFLATTIKAGQA